jgi:hypothetical protein
VITGLHGHDWGGEDARTSGGVHGATHHRDVLSQPIAEFAVLRPATGGPASMCPR